MTDVTKKTRAEMLAFVDTDIPYTGPNLVIRFCRVVSMIMTLMLAGWLVGDVNVSVTVKLLALLGLPAGYMVDCWAFGSSILSKDDEEQIARENAAIRMRWCQRVLRREKKRCDTIRSGGFPHQCIFCKEN
jgi:hypothetical protein